MEQRKNADLHVWTEPTLQSNPPINLSRGCRHKNRRYSESLLKEPSLASAPLLYHTCKRELSCACKQTRQVKPVGCQNKQSNLLTGTGERGIHFSSSGQFNCLTEITMDLKSCGILFSNLLQG
ncbi:hypothetical protein ILYODFUR_026602, partial [Ilyodon furcidens]